MATFGFSSAGSNGSGTEFLSMLPPPGVDLAKYDGTKPHTKQDVPLPQIFRDAMSVREEVYGEQGVPLEAEFDEDDARSWHWVVYASVASTSSAAVKDGELRADSPTNGSGDVRRASAASSSRLPVGTIRLIPPPHGPNQYIKPGAEGSQATDKHADAGPSNASTAPDGSDAAPALSAHEPKEPYLKLGRLAVLTPYRSFGLAKLLINAALQYAAEHPNDIYQPPSPTAMELASRRGKAAEEAVTWNGLVMIHAQVQIRKLWERYGFEEEIEGVEREATWWEEGIEHVGMWKRLKV